MAEDPLWSKPDPGQLASPTSDGGAPISVPPGTPPPPSAPPQPSAPPPGAQLPPGGQVPQPSGPIPEKAPHPCDPLAAALGNATLLGVGYMLMRRWGAAVATIVTSAVLLLLVSAFGQPGWFWRVVLALWWLVTVVSGWRSARASSAPPIGTDQSVSPPAATEPPARPAGTKAWRQRAIAAGTAGMIVLAVVVIALDTRRIEAAAAAEHEAGNCAEAIDTLQGFEGWHRVVDPFVSGRADDHIALCTLLVDALAEEDPVEAASLLDQYIDGGGLWPDAVDGRADLLLEAAEAALDTTSRDIGDLGAGFGFLAAVLADAPDRAGDVEAVISDYLDRLPEAGACTAMAHLEWLRKREPSGDVLDRAAEAVDAIAPPVLLACGDQLLAVDAQGSLDAYHELLERYPDSEQASAAQSGINNAEGALELEVVRGRIGSGQPGYCTNPAPYRFAPPWQGGGPHRILPLGSQEFADGVPAEWKALDAAEATLIVCATGPDAGAFIQTCYYEGDFYRPAGHAVSLHGTQFGAKVFELRTGALVVDTTLSFGGGCPPVLEWRCSGYLPTCPPPPTVRAGYSGSAIRDGVSPWVFR